MAEKLREVLKKSCRSCKYYESWTESSRQQCSYWDRGDDYYHSNFPYLTKWSTKKDYCSRFKPKLKR